MITELDSTPAYHRWPNHLFFALFETLKGQKRLFYGYFEQFNLQKSTRKALLRFFWTLSTGC